MHDPWTHLRDAFEKAIANLEKREPAHARSNLKGAEHTAHTIGTKAHGEERERAGRIYLAVQKAVKTIDPARALAILREAHGNFTQAAPPPPSGGANL